jgi:hypothetical protein
MQTKPALLAKREGSTEDMKKKEKEESHSALLVKLGSRTWRDSIGRTRPWIEIHAQERNFPEIV